MKTIGEAIIEFRIQNPEFTIGEISAFIKGWTACEVAADVSKLLTIKAN